MDRCKFIKTCGLVSTSLLLSNDVLANQIQTTERGHIVKPIAGFWSEFLHSSDAEGKYWNSVLPGFSEMQWCAKIREMSDIGMWYLVLMAVANNGKTFYPSKLQPQYDYVCNDPLEAVLSEADLCGIKFFVSNDFWGNSDDTYNMMTDKNISALREKAMVEIVEKYGHHQSFYGWYYPNESGLWNTIDDLTLRYVNDCSRIARQLMPKSVNLIASYGTKSVRADGEYVRKLEKLDIDIIAYQDEVGVKKTRAGYASKYFETLCLAHKKAGRAKIWADIEIFGFEGDVYKTALIPADFNRVLKQMEDISSFVDNILIYQHLWLMNKPGSMVFAGHPESTDLYEVYAHWYKQGLKNKVW
jgi:hypothetical protein